MLSNPLAAVQSTTSASGVSGNGAVSRPSLIARHSPRRDVGDRRACARRGPIDVDPATVSGALGDRIADEHLVVAVGEGGVRRPLGRPAGHDVRVDRPEERPERVAEALDVAARQRGGGAPGRRPSGPGCG